ncbi:MAG: DEAD/DEAH box helicase [Chitinophagaceae bacterium]|nr:DEAD/DEAH box helicase [Chitinophagaceae bacterium]
MEKEVGPFGEILARLKIEALNKMQLAALEANKQDKDIVLISATGSGKTLAFLLPLLELMDADSRATQAMAIVPSRELALQIEQVFRSMRTGFTVACCYGGRLRETEENNLLQAPALIIGTPGRLADHLRRGNIRGESIRTLVLDEFDKSLEQGYEEELSFIIGSLSGLQKRILTSATRIADIPAYVGLKESLLLDHSSETKTEALAIQWIRSEEKDKLGTLYELLCLAAGRSTIVFCNHRESVERISDWLSDKGVLNVYYHGSMEQRDREMALFKFRNGTSTVLVTTDLAARGLDIPYIRYIIHYHLPLTAEIFTHRNGRTARMEASGTAILILGPEEDIPAYVKEEALPVTLPPALTPPDKPKWSTLFIAAGKKDKINKVDIVGFLTNKGQLKKEDLGLIEVKDFMSFAAVRKSKIGFMLEKIKNEKIKNKKVKMGIAK